MAIVTDATARQDIFKELHGLLDANKLTGWTVLSAYPEVKPTFPVIVINPVEVNPNFVTLSGGCRDNLVDVVIEIYTKAKEGKEQNDKGKDNVSATLLTNANSFHSSTGLSILNITDGGSDTFIENNEKINFGALNVSMRF